jgi:enoyl-CoA hydratase/carnithine racemase
MHHQFIRYTVQDHIAEIALTKATKMNAMDSALLKELSQCLTELEHRNDIKCLIIEGSGGIFSAGGDLNYMAKMDEYEGRESARWIHGLFERIENMPFITLALVDGIAFGGGLEMALSCDICIATDQAQFALPEMRYGIIPAGGGTVRFMEKTSSSELLYALTSNKIYTAAEARQSGFVQDIVQKDDLDAFKQRYISKIQSYSLNNIFDIKKHISNIQSGETSEMRAEWFEQEARLFGKLLEKEGRERINAFFAKKKKENKDG